MPPKLEVYADEKLTQKVEDGQALFFGSHEDGSKVTRVIYIRNEGDAEVLDFEMKITPVADKPMGLSTDRRLPTVLEANKTYPVNLTWESRKGDVYGDRFAYIDFEGRHVK